MIKNILFGVDGSPGSAIAGDYAMDFARRLGARLEAVHVLDSRVLEYPLIAPQTGVVTWSPAAVNGLQEALRTRGETLLRETAARGEQAGIPIATRLELGHPVQILADIQAGTELIVLGRQGEHARSAPDVPGSTMERFIRRATRPCLVTPRDFHPVDKILVAVDGSDSAGRALHEAAELANALHAPLIILAVAEHDNELPLAQQNALEAHSRVRAHGCAAANLTALGPAAHQVLDKAAETGCYMIVVGSHGHGWIYERLIGSVAAHVVSNSRHPVMLVR